MSHLFVCPACRIGHEEPAHAAFVLAVLCLECELEERYRLEGDELAVIEPAAA